MQEIPKDVLLRASHGDVESFREIYDSAGGFVYNVALRVAGHKEDAEEITQEVFLMVYRKLKDFRFESSFKTWVYRITVNQAINHVKQRGKSSAVEYDENTNAVAVQPRAGEEMEREAREKLVQKLLSELNPEQRACIVLRSLEGLSYEEIASSLGININTVRSRLKRAREALMNFAKGELQHEL